MEAGAEQDQLNVTFHSQLLPNSQKAENEMGQLCHQSLEKYVLGNFQMRECKQFVRETSNSSGEVCGCGRTKTWHTENGLPDVSSEVTKWNVKTCTTTKPTNAFGKCQMLGYSGGDTICKTKFLRFDAVTTKMESVQCFMKKFWGLEPPQLIISINGGTKKMEKCDDQLHKVIKRGLYKTTTSLKTWIVTTGIYDGVSRLIGQAVHDRPVEARMDKSDFIVIGITSWGTVYKSHRLINQKTDNRNSIPHHRYFNEPGGAGKGEVILDPNHTHLLLVDDGTMRKYNGEVNFRTNFEAFRSNEHRLIGETETVKLQLLIEGGHAALPTLESELKNNSPIIIVKHSGRCADLLCNMLQRTTPDTSKEEIIRIYEDELQTNFSKWDMVDKVKKQCQSTIINFVKNRENVYIFDYRDEEDEELDKFILRVIFRRNSDLDINDKMKLAMRMKRCDLAREEVLTYDCIRKSDHSDPQKLNLNVIMTEALKNDVAEFVELLLSEGLVIEQYLTADILYDMYFKNVLKKDLANKFLLRILEARRGFYGNRHQLERGQMMQLVGKLIRYLTNELVVQLYDENDFPSPESNAGNSSNHAPVCDNLERLVPCSSPQTTEFPQFPPRCEGGGRIFTAFDLFIWAILHNRMELAKIFWRVSKDQVSVALVGSFIMRRLRVLAVSEGEVSLASRYEENSQLFEALALELLSIAYACGKKRTHILLCRSLPYCHGNTCLFLAYQFGFMAFLHHPACQTRLSRIWMGAIPTSVSLKRVVMNIPLAPLTIRSIFPAEAAIMDDLSPGPEDKYSCKAEHKKQKKLQNGNSVELHQDHKGQNYWKALNLFYSAPITKFANYVMSYYVFLFVLTYFVLIELEPVESISQITIWECLTWIYCVDISVEEIRQVSDASQSNIWSKIRYWISGTGSSWNKYDFGAICFFLLSVILRFTLPASQFAFVRVSFGLMIVIFYIRSLQFYLVHRTIGPKVIIINKMLKDLLFFLYIFVVFLFAYGSFIQALIYPNKEPSLATLHDIVRFPFWQAFGELNLEYYEGNKTCEAGSRGCGVQSPMVELAGGVYILSVNVLLINLLIAIFGYTFNMVHETSEKVWAFYRFGLIEEFQERELLPSPFVLISIVLTCIAKRCKKLSGNHNAKSNPFNFRLSTNMDNKIAQFENNCAHMYHAREEEDTDNVLHYRMSVILRELQQLREPRITNVTTYDPLNNENILPRIGPVLGDAPGSKEDVE